VQKAVFDTLAILLSGFLLAACAPQQQTINLSSTFNSAEAEFILTDGNATITGQGFLRQKGGGVVTCAGAPVHLFPKTKYTNERMRHLYGGTNGGVNYNLTPKFTPDSFDYYELARQEQCDAQGHFEFSNVPAGEFYVTTSVNWIVANVRQGGAIMQPIDVAPGEKVNVLLTQ
jgi:hypothetical protein